MEPVTITETASEMNSSILSTEQYRKQSNKLYANNIKASWASGYHDGLEKVDEVELEEQSIKKPKDKDKKKSKGKGKKDDNEDEEILSPPTIVRKKNK